MFIAPRTFVRDGESQYFRTEWPPSQWKLRQVTFKRKRKILTGLFYNGHPLMPHMGSRVRVDCNVGLETERMSSLWHHINACNITRPELTDFLYILRTDDGVGSHQNQRSPTGVGNIPCPTNCMTGISMTHVVRRYRTRYAGHHSRREADPDVA